MMNRKGRSRSQTEQIRRREESKKGEKEAKKLEIKV